MKMRNAFFLLTALCSSLISFSQFAKGDKMLGVSVGTFSGNSGTTKFTTGTSAAGYDSKSNNFTVSVSPSIGWFVKDDLAVGVSLNFRTGSYKTDDLSRDTTFRYNKTTTFDAGIGGFVRKYFKSSKTLLPFIQANVNAGVSGSNNNGFVFASDIVGVYKDSYESKTSGGLYANIGAGIGATKMLGTNVGLDFSIGYNYNYNKNDFSSTTKRDYLTAVGDFTSESKYTSKLGNHGFNIGVGVQVFLGNKK